MLWLQFQISVFKMLAVFNTIIFLKIGTIHKFIN